jgi:hypothetical protein
MAGGEHHEFRQFCIVDANIFILTSLRRQPRGLSLAPTLSPPLHSSSLPSGRLRRLR